MESHQPCISLLPNEIWDMIAQKFTDQTWLRFRLTCRYFNMLGKAQLERCFIWKISGFAASPFYIMKIKRYKKYSAGDGEFAYFYCKVARRAKYLALEHDDYGGEKYHAFDVWDQAKRDELYRRMWTEDGLIPQEFHRGCYMNVEMPDSAWVHVFELGSGSLKKQKKPIWNNFTGYGSNTYDDVCPPAWLKKPFKYEDTELDPHHYHSRPNPDLSILD